MARKPLDIVHPKVARYLESLVPPRDRVLAEMEARAQSEDIPIVGPLVGRLFFQLALMTGREARDGAGLGDRLFDDVVGPRRRVRRGGVVHRREPGERRRRDPVPRARRRRRARALHGRRRGEVHGGR